MTTPRNNPTGNAEQTSGSELNPLQNPTLGRNLGRWAQVYFTNPPENRERAVVELLRELETGAVPAPDGSSSSKLGHSGVLCPHCQHESESGQRFCVNCGSSLTAILEPAKYDRAFVGSHPVPSFAPISPQGDAQWLRDKACASFDSNPPKRQAWKYLFAAIMVALAGLGYLGWSARSDRVRATKPAAAVPAEPQIETKPSKITPADSESEKMSLSKLPAKTVESGVNRERSAKAPTLAVRGRKVGPNLSEATSKLAVGNGARELLIARRYLDSKGGTQDISEAAKWLWKAVGKQNTSAAVLLADLYARGDGVAKNCDQARLLLVAAAKKGASDAAEKLRNLESNGCS